MAVLLFGGLLDPPIYKTETFDQTLMCEITSEDSPACFDYSVHDTLMNIVWISLLYFSEINPS